LISSTIRDPDLAATLGEVIDAAGPDGAILVEDAQTTRTTCQYLDGVRWNEGYLSTFLLRPSATTGARLLNPPPAPDLHTVLVVPFEVFGQTEGAAYLGYAFAQALAVNLAPAKDYRILPVPALSALEGSGPDARAKNALRGGAARLIVGTLTREAHNLHASLTLVDATQNRIIWGTQREGNEDEVLLLAADLAHDVATQIGWTGGAGKHLMLYVPSNASGCAYGLGTVVSVQGSGDDPEAKIDFGGEYGIKHLVLRYAPIEKL
jgi:TolB-like protein